MSEALRLERYTLASLSTILYLPQPILTGTMTELADRFFARTDFLPQDGIHLMALAPRGMAIAAAIMSNLTLKEHTAWFSTINMEKAVNTIPQPSIKGQMTHNILVTDEFADHCNKLDEPFQLLQELNIEIDLITSFVATGERTNSLHMWREIPVMSLFHPDEVVIKNIL